MFEVIAIDPVSVQGPDVLLDRDLMSPFVWRVPDGNLGVLLRVVLRPAGGAGVTGRIWYGQCDRTGTRFFMDDQPLIEPGRSGLDVGGCEDPTVVPTDKACVVYYTGVDANGDAQMLYAEGPDIRSLSKRGVALASSKTERNTKEAAVDHTSTGRWQLFYEYSSGGRSRIGLACGPGPHGPWEEQADPLRARRGSWDSWHLSTGPLVMTDAAAPVMFYNGADRKARWGIGWVVLDPGCTQAVDRSTTPLIGPPIHTYEERDSCFVASAVQMDEEIWLYFSKNDRLVFRARVRRNRSR